MNRSRRERAEGALAVALLLGAVAGLHAIGGQHLAPPNDRSVAGLQHWSSARDAPTAAMALLRLAALALGWFQVGTVALGLVARRCGLPALARRLDGWTLPVLRRAGVGLAGLGLVATTLLTATPVGAEPNSDPPAATVTLQVLENSPPAPGEATLRVEGEAAPQQPVPAAVPRATSTRQPDPWTVAPGDHLWAIAEATVREVGGPGSTPAEQEVAAYWRTLVAANPQLANPDLIFPGQQLTRPAIP